MANVSPEGSGPNTVKPDVERTSALLSRYEDPDLGELIWDESAWVGFISFGASRVPLCIDLDDEAQTHAQQIEAIGFAKTLVAKICTHEVRLRQLAAEEIAEAAGAHASNEDRRRYLAEVSRAAAALDPQALCIAFPEGGHLEYRDSGKVFYGDAIVVIRFDGEAQYEEVELD